MFISTILVIDGRFYFVSTVHFAKLNRLLNFFVLNVNGPMILVFFVVAFFKFKFSSLVLFAIFLAVVHFLITHYQ